MFGGCCEYLGEVCAVGVYGVSHEGASGTQGHGQVGARPWRSAYRKVFMQHGKPISVERPGSTRLGIVRIHSRVHGDHQGLHRLTRLDKRDEDSEKAKNPGQYRRYHVRPILDRP